MPQGWTPVAEPSAAPTGWTPVSEADFRATNEPPSIGLKAAAYGKDALQLALEALPGAGAVVGGVLATPETMGGGTLAGAALGAGAGRGLRDLVAAGLGLQKPSTATTEGGRIAMDAAETYVAGKVLPALWEAIKTPGATVNDVVDRTKTLYKYLPKHLKGFLPDFDQLATLPKGVGKAPAAILERPAAQTWEQFLESTKQPTPPIPRGTSTSMIPGAMPTSAPAPEVPAPAAAVAAPPVSAPAVEPVAPARPVNTLPDQKALNEARLAEIRAAYQAKLRAATPPAAADPIVPASGKMQLTAAEMKEFTRLTGKGMPLQTALETVKAMRDLATRLGGATPAEVTASVAQRARSGKW